MERVAQYPFTAIVGQEEMKLSLILNVINPLLGGVLIKGEKGTAKSTAVRALAELLPAMECVHGCRFHCNPENPNDWCDDCRAKQEKKVPCRWNNGRCAWWNCLSMRRRTALRVRWT